MAFYVASSIGSIPLCGELLSRQIEWHPHSPNWKYLSKVVSSEIVMADPTRHAGEASSASVQLEGCVIRFPASILNNRERYGVLSWKPKDFDADEGAHRQEVMVWN